MPSTSKDEQQEKWKTIIDFTKIRKVGIPVEELLELLRRSEKTYRDF